MERRKFLGGATAGAAAVAALAASFPKPADMTGLSDAYAGFVYVQLDREQPRFTVARNVISEELEGITSSSGDKFEEKFRELKTTVSSTKI